MRHLCNIMGIRQSTRTPYSPWTNRLAEIQNENLGRHCRMVSQTPQSIGHTMYVHKFTRVLHLGAFLQENFSCY